MPPIRTSTLRRGFSESSTAIRPVIAVGDVSPAPVAKTLIVDPFARGAVVERPRLVELLRRVHGDEAKLAEEHLAEARNRDILFRVQHNIVLRSRRRGDAAAALAAVDRAILIEPARAALWLEAAQLSAEIGQLMKARNCLDAVARFDADRHFAARAGALRAQLNTRLN